MVDLLLGPAGFLTVLPGDEDIRLLKTLGVLYNRNVGGLTMPARYTDVGLLWDAGIKTRFGPGVREALVPPYELADALQTAGEVAKPASHPAWDKLDPHQRVAVAFLASRPRALLALSPGLGKTATSVAAAELLGLDPILVVAPLTLLHTWREEIIRWSEDGAEVSVANLRDGEPLGRWNLVNPEGLSKLPTKQFELLILDESVLYKNRNAKRTKAVGKLARQADYTWLLSGSPTAKYADDLWAQMNIMHPEWFTSYWRFTETWCRLSDTPWGTKVVGNRDPAGLRDYLADLMLSRTPEQVPVLPAAPVETLHVQLTKRQEKELKRAKEELVIADIQLPGVLPQLVRMAQMVSYPPILGVNQPGGKMAAFKELLEYSARPMLVWCQFVQTAEAVAAAATAAGIPTGLIHGGVSAKARKQLLESYQAGDIEVLVMQIATGKFGLSLTNTRTQVFYDRSFSLDDWVQAVARVRRRSSKRVVPTIVMNGGWTDKLVDAALKRKLRSVQDLGISDLLQYMA